MNRTVRDMTKELGTNKNVIYRIIERQNLEPVPTANPKETKRYDDESYQIIKDEFSRLQEKHGENKTETENKNRTVSSDLSILVQTLQRQIDRYENEIDRLNAKIEQKDETIRQKDETIRELTDQLGKANEYNHAQTIRYQEIIAREQSTKLLLAAQTTKFNLFKPSTWKRNKTETPDLEPLTPTETDGQI